MLQLILVYALISFLLLANRLLSGIKKTHTQIYYLTVSLGHKSRYSMTRFFTEVLTGTDQGLKLSSGGQSPPTSTLVVFKIPCFQWWDWGSRLPASCWLGTTVEFTQNSLICGLQHRQFTTRMLVFIQNTWSASLWLLFFDQLKNVLLLKCSQD